MKEICKIFAEQFGFNSSSDNHSHRFNPYRLTVERKTTEFDTNYYYLYNDVFRLHELKHANKIYVLGIDIVHYQLPRHLPDESMLLLWYVFNHICSTHDRLLLVYLFLSRVRCFQILVVTGLLPLLAVYVKQWSRWSTVD